MCGICILHLSRVFFPNSLCRTTWESCTSSSFRSLVEDEDVIDVYLYTPVEYVTRHGSENSSRVGETE